MPHPFTPISASWISKHQIRVLLSYDWPKHESLPPLYFDSTEFPILTLQRAPLYLFAQLSGYFIQGKNITFLCPINNLEISKKVFVAGNFNNWGAAIGQQQWQLKPKTIEKYQALMLTIPWEQCDNPHAPSFFKFVTEDNVWLPVPTDAPNFISDSHNNINYQINPHCTGKNAFVFSPPLAYDPSMRNQILWIDTNTDKYHTNPIDDSAVFLKLGSTQPLGAIVNKNSTLFRLFAPRASAVHVTFYDNSNQSSSKTLDLNRNADYTWEITYPMNLHGQYYYYTVSTDQSTADNILDPYALATVGPGGPGIIINTQSIPKINEKFKVPKWIDLVILESHLRDLVSNTTFGADFQLPIGFHNLTSWLNDKHNYIKELGINAIELLPIQEYECESPSQYHWGYIPTNYFCPTSSYTLPKTEISQITDFQELVNTFHKAKIAVILDVVYNHSGNPNHLLHIDKDYYFESTKEGTLTNWSGCGNDFRANTPMGKRLIIDSLTYLITTYNIDGFRFDLAELIGVEVLKEIESALKAIKPSIILIAEPWSFRGHIAHALKSTGFASWNDEYREFITNYVLDRSNINAFTYFITGSTSYLTRFTSQSLNYASSHDDYCWLDRITENPNHDGSNPTFHDIRRTHLMIAILMMSVGIPMLAEGQDILHSKLGHNNTYQRADLNALDYTKMTQYSNTHEYFSKWIQFRLSKNARAIRIQKMPSPHYFKFFKNPESSTVAVLYNADHSLKNVPQLLFVVNQHLTTTTLNLNDLNPNNFSQIADHDRMDSNGLNDGLIEWKNNLLTLPPLSCGLWINTQSKA